MRGRPLSLFTGRINRARKRTDYSVRNFFSYVAEDSSSKVIIVIPFQRVLEWEDE